MEKQVLHGLAQQWENIKSLMSVLDSLKIEERSGVDLGTLAIEELQKYVNENSQLKENIEKMKDTYEEKIENLQDENRTYKEKLQEAEHAKSVEVCTLY